MVVVKSAGNNGDGITCFGNAANVITVGATDYEGNLASYSSKNTDKMAATKPTLVAYGMPHIPKETIWFHGNGNMGTSFAAPFVTGTVAIMMNKKPSLKLFPEWCIPCLLQIPLRQITQPHLKMQTDFYPEWEPVC